jgi:hypothetical protein
MVLRTAERTVNAKKVLQYLGALGLTQPRRLKGPKWTRPAIRVDCDPRFMARSFREATGILNVRLEYAGIQCPEDNPYIESFFGSYKTEDLYRNEYSSLAEVRTSWESYRAG